jgi:hypothetical protein
MEAVVAPLKPAPKPRVRAKKPAGAAQTAVPGTDVADVVDVPKPAPKPRARAKKPAGAAAAGETPGPAPPLAAAAPVTDTVAKPDKAAALARARRLIAETNYTQRVHELAAWATKLSGDPSEDARLRAAQRTAQWRHAADNAELYISAHVDRLVWCNLPAM